MVSNNSSTSNDVILLRRISLPNSGKDAMIIQLNRPEKLNCFNTCLCQELALVVTKLISEQLWQQQQPQRTQPLPTEESLQESSSNDLNCEQHQRQHHHHPPLPLPPIPAPILKSAVSNFTLQQKYHMIQSLWRGLFIIKIINTSPVYPMNYAVPVFSLTAIETNEKGHDCMHGRKVVNWSQTFWA